MNRQTLIPINAESESSFGSFRAGGNAELLAELTALARGDGARRVLYFWGEAGSGKTHLLNACCQLARDLGKPHAYLPLGGHAHGAQDDSRHDSDCRQAQLAGIAPQSLVCIDDFQAIAASGRWQAALFGLYEKLLGDGGALVVGANQPISLLNLALKDLESRLMSGGVHALTRLNEQDKLAALKARARQKGFDLTDQALRFIITYYKRDTASLFSLLERIDNASLAAQRKITVPFIKSLL